MDKEEAALLAELRAISAKSATSRFQEQGDVVDDNRYAVESPKNVPKEEDAHKDATTTEPIVKGNAIEVDPSPLPAETNAVQNENPAIIVSEPVEEPGFGDKTSSSSYTGERGGAAEDAELLAELRAISAKSSLRFSANDDDNDETAGDAAEATDEKRTEKPATSPRTSGIPTPTSSSKKNRERSALPPWKRDKKKAAMDDNVDVIVAAPPQPSVLNEEDAELVKELKQISQMVRDSGRLSTEGNDASSGLGKKGETPVSDPDEGGFTSSSTFTGERGGAAEDAELLAELRAISSKSSSAARFAASDDEGPAAEADDPTGTPASEPIPPPKAPAPQKKVSPKRDDSALPPWKRRKRGLTKEASVDVVVAAPAKDAGDVNTEGGGFQSSLPSTFSGDRGGAAEDADLLAELRAISSKSGGSARFASENDDVAPTESSPPRKEAPKPSPSTKKRDPSSIPPWKRGRKKPSTEQQVVVVVAGTPRVQTSQESMESVSSPSPANTGASQGGGLKSSLPSTFTGDRGGAAEDAELLAELRAISSKSSSSARFAGDDEDVSVNDKQMESSPVPKASTTPKAASTIKEVRQSPSVVAPPSSAEDEVLNEGGGFKSSIPSTFTGERGGAAEDADLLAELRAISSKSSSSGRFAESPTQEDVVVATKSEAPPASPKPAYSPSTRKITSAKKDPSKVPPWKRGKAKSAKSNEPSVEVNSKPPPSPQADGGGMGGGFKSSLPSTFKGERGGAAEDAELLKELRAISSSTSGSRFNSGAKTEDVPVTPTQTPSQKSPETPTTPSTYHTPLTTSKSPPPSAADTEEEVLVTRESLQSGVVNKKWKVRKQAYELLSTLLSEAVAGKEATGDFDANSTMPGLDDALPKMVADSNASALDSALKFCNMYAEYCRGAGSAERAANVVNSMLKGSAFSASRPSTTKLSGSLTLKLMEVGTDGVASVHAVIDSLLSKGLTSRKPKVVLAAVTLILDAANKFGAGCLPLAAIASNTKKMLAHSNPKVRDTGMKIIAEICRAAGSKAPLEDVINGMKTAQQSQLDGLLQKQPKPHPIDVQLRSKRHESASSESPDDVMAAFEAGAKELEAKRLAARAAVNIFEELPKTDYSTRIQLPKWSEKVGALDTLLQCGGEKPYKLVQPSSSSHYVPLISEMRKLLSHTHFAVCAKSMEVLSMFASGVGEKLFPNLRPLLTTLLQLSKDKKLTKAVGSCLDTFFGNVLGFDHLLDKESAIPSELDERKQKNTLVRSSALAYLQRCVQRNASAGPRGKLSVQSSERIAHLCCEKAGDSDASVRKAISGVLQSLLSFDNDQIQIAVDGIVEGDLKSKHPRVYKSLKSSRSSGTKASGKRDTREGSTEKSAARLPPRSPVRNSATGTPKRRGDSSSHPTPTKEHVELVAGNDGEAEAISADVPSLDKALAQVSALGIPEWSKSEDDGGVLAGLKSSKWLSRQNAIKAFAAFVASDSMGSSGEIPSGEILVVVKEHTKGFKESNFNVTKAIMELVIGLCKAHEKFGQPLCSWACRDGSTICVEKISDRKLSSMSNSLLTSLCVARNTETVLRQAVKTIEKARSPIAHEALLKWCKSMCDDFGALTIGNGVKDCLVPWLVKECGSTNPKVRSAALQLVGELHFQLGPAFKALTLSSCPDESVKGQIEKKFQQHLFDASASKAERLKKCIMVETSADAARGGGGPASSLGIDIPRTDLADILPDGCISKMGSKEGKTAWKMRKEAMEEVSTALEKSNGMISTSNMKFLVELLRALKERLFDSQSNLKPVAARIIGSILAAVDKVSQAKLGRIVYGPLISAVMNDNRKPMRDAALEAITVGTQMSSLEGGGPNTLALEPLLIALVAELNSSERKGGGIPDMLLFVVNVSGFLPKMDSITVSRAQSLGEQFASAVVKCLTSSKSETRAAAESLLKACLQYGSIGIVSVKKGTEQLFPAQKRTVTPIITRLQGETTESSPTKADAHSNPVVAASGKPKTGAAGSPVSAGGKRPTDKGKPRSSHPGTTKKQSAESPPQPPALDDTVHPLQTANLVVTAPSKQKRLKSRTNWPDHPEEPNTAAQLNHLKKLWTPFLPVSTISILFPNTGIRKQEDAQPGCELLARAIRLERSGNGVLVVEQLDFILKWVSFSLCSRENPVGLQALLSFLLDVFQWLHDQRYELSVEEANYLVPHIYEKAGAAKGRFLDQFNELITIITLDDVLPPSKLGPVICVSLIERTQHPKTRVLAYRECQKCVDKIGLNGISKKGVLVTAKSLSEETLPENKGAALDLMECVLGKMNGDIKRLARICGPSNLSDKAKTMLEEHWKKHNSGDGATLAHPADPDTSRRRSQIPSARKAAVSAGLSPRRQNNATMRSSPGEKVPALQLRLGDTSFHRSRGIDRGEIPADGPFTFSFQSTTTSDVTASSDVFHDANDVTADSFHKRYNVQEIERSVQNINQQHGVASTSSSSSQIGAAASLRARLIKIREKHKTSEGVSEVSPERERSGDTKSQQHQSETSAGLSPRIDKDRENDPDVYAEGIVVIKKLLQQPAPVSEDDESLLDCISTLKKFYGFLENQGESGGKANRLEIRKFRNSILERTEEMIEHLTSVIGFAFRCDPQFSAGICIPLLSTALATLIAFFRDKTLSARVSQEALTLLIREAGTALLDSRLAATSSTSLKLDEQNSSQLVRAINKLAVQAATGSPRHTSLQALMTLQLQLCSQNKEKDATDSVFNKRLSRIVTKLFSRVLKAEDATPTPFLSPAIDMEALLCSVEDILVASDKTEGEMTECTDMAKSLVRAICLSRKDRAGVEDVRRMLDDIGISSTKSRVALLVNACEPEMGSVADTDLGAAKEASSSVDVATLVSNIGRVPEGPERKSALDALRQFRDTHGDAELTAHLEDVSAPFKAYILEQLSASDTARPGVSGTLHEVGNRNNLPMSERIKQIKSKLHVTEATVPSAVGTSVPEQSSTGEPIPDVAAVQSVPSPTRKSFGERTTNLPKPGATSFQQRLAAAKEQRSKAESQGLSLGTSTGKPTSSLGHAAALRARLEAVKHQGRQKENTSAP